MIESIIDQQKTWTDDIHNMSGWICYSLWSIHQWQAVDTFNTSPGNNDEFELKSSEKRLKYVSPLTPKQWKKKALNGQWFYWHYLQLNKEEI